MTAIQHFDMPDGRILTIDFLNIDSLLSVSKEDWKHVNDYFEKVLSWFKELKNEK